MPPPPPPGGTVNVSPTVETPNRAPAGTNDADDAAIWVHPTDPAKSLILGAVKQWGLDVYRPDGTVVQTSAPAAAASTTWTSCTRTLGGVTRDLAIVTDRKTDKLHIYRVDGNASPPVVEVTASGVPLLFGTTTKINSRTAYGVAAWRTPAGTVEVFVSQENTTNLGKFVLTAAAGGTVTYQRTATLEPAQQLHAAERVDVDTVLQPEQAHLAGARRGHGGRSGQRNAVGRPGDRRPLDASHTSLTSPQLVHNAWPGSARRGRSRTTSASSTTARRAMATRICRATSRASASTGPATGRGLPVHVEPEVGRSSPCSTEMAGPTAAPSESRAAGSIDAVSKTDGVAVTNVSMGPGFPQAW